MLTLMSNDHRQKSDEYISNDTTSFHININETSDDSVRCDIISILI